MSDQLISAHELVRLAGLANVGTIRTWQRAGALPRPMIAIHPSGRGRVGLYSVSLVDRCRKIAELLRRGLSLRLATESIQRDEILHALGRGQFEPGADQASAVGAVAEVSVAAVLLALLHQSLGRLLQPETRDQIIAAARSASPRILGRAMKLVSCGAHPVFVYDGSRAEVLPDFILAQRLADGTHGDMGPVIAVSLVPILRRGLAAAKRELPGGVVVRPARLVYIERSGHLARRHWVERGSGEFDFVPEFAGPPDAVAGTE